jgi:hypothetical protein
VTFLGTRTHKKVPLVNWVSTNLAGIPSIQRLQASSVGPMYVSNDISIILPGLEKDNEKDFKQARELPEDNSE